MHLRVVDTIVRSVEATLKMVQEKVEFRTRRVCVIMQQTEGRLGNPSHRVEGQHAFVMRHREVLQFLS